MRLVWCVLLVLAVAGHAVSAAEKEPNDVNDPNYPSDPNKLLQLKWDAVTSVLQNKELDQKAKDKQVDKIVSPIFDFALMAKLALGREHWPKLTGPQREKFTHLFVQRLKTSYQEKVALYTDEKAVFKRPVQKQQKKIIHIPMDLISRDKKVDVLYKLRQVDERRKVKVDEGCAKVEKRWKIYDVEIQGVSILLTYRSQFDDILRSGTVEDLLLRLEAPPPR